MDLSSSAAFTLDQEARGLLTRLARVKPFALIMPAVTAANISRDAATAIDEHLVTGRRELRNLVHQYLQWLQTHEGRRAKPEEWQRRLSILRLKFNAVLTQFDIFADALMQRCEYENGVWLAGLDLLANDALALPGGHFDPPPLVTYLDRGHGAAIRRARTRLPGGGKNPVAIIRIPRERMVGSGIASSLVHEVGHQGAALLDLVNSMRATLQERQKRRPVEHRMAWELWQRWISEILADFWSVAKVGVAATQGLMGVVSLPRAFVFRINVDDPHPVPWIRVKLSTAMGQALYPHPQWDELAKMWEAFYPKADLSPEKKRIIDVLEETIPQFVREVTQHRPRSLGGRTLSQVFPLEERQPARLAVLSQRWNASPQMMEKASPTLVFAALGQARQDRKIVPAKESRIVAKLLIKWALGRTVRPLSSQNKRRLQQSPLGTMTAATP